MTTSKTIILILVLAIIALGAYLLGKQEVTAPIVDNTPIEEESDGENDEAQVFADGQCPGFIVTSPSAGDVVTFPLTISGTVHPTSHPGQWIVFEGEAGVVVAKDVNSTVISGPGIMSLNVEWMNSNPKPFSVTIPALTSVPSTNAINLVFTDNNASDEGTSHTCVLGVTL